EGRECRIAAEDSGGQEQPPMLWRIALEGEISGYDAHHQRTADIDDEGRIGKVIAEDTDAGQIKTVTDHCADAAAEKHHQIPHRLSFLMARQQKSRLAAARTSMPAARAIPADRAMCRQESSAL